MAIGIGADRTPIWPDGLVGSISHCDGFCGAVVARSSDLCGIGFDAETSSPLPDDVGRIIYGEEESSHFSDLPKLKGRDWGKLAFSAKEAFYKCFFPLTRKALNFHHVQVRFGADGDFEITSDPAGDFLSGNVQGRWLMGDGLVFTSFVKTP
jgi:4'-phosphopantetheinyl transferase EntD